MLGLVLNKVQSTTLSILCLGAHSDDIEIGCYGTICRLLTEFPNSNITWIVFGAYEARAREANESAESLLKLVEEKKILIRAFQDGYFPYNGAEIKGFFEELKKELSPDLIFTHYRNDLHQDHRLINELTWNTFRDHLILEYEIPKFDGDLGAPNFFVHLDERMCLSKIEHIGKHFKSQESRQWFSGDTFKAIMRLRGIESNAPEKFAEAFYSRKIIY